MQSSESGRSIFALARFDRIDAQQRGLIQGQGTVIHFTIPTKAPWIPLRILALGKTGVEFVDADLFVLTDQRPTFYPTISSIQGMQVQKNEWASTSLLSDLRGDKGMSWLPASGMWFTAMQLHTTARRPHGPAGRTHVPELLSERQCSQPEPVQGIILGQGGASFPLDWLVKREDASPFPTGVGGRLVSLRLGDRTA